MGLSINTGALYILGLAHKYPPYSFGPDDFEDLITRLYPQHATSLGLQKMMQFNRQTQIHSRRTAFDSSKWTKDDAAPPNIDELSQIFRSVGVDLAASACREAMQEAHLSAADITHVVAVTCTDQGNPGYDLLVCQKLQLRPDVQRVLLHGVGCAGGLSALRAGANLAAAESQKGRPARILVMACELCSLFLRAELLAASRDDALHIAPALFSDAAAALVVCNELALENQQKPIFELQEWGSMMMPASTDFMSYMVKDNGLIATLTKDVPKTAVSSFVPMFDHLHNAARTSYKHSSWTQLEPSNFDWAVHPGGAAILQGAQRALQLTEDHIRASLKVYREYGNASSPTVLVVLDKLRRMGKGRDHIVSTSFGPGMMIEMFVMKRCRDIDQVPSLRPRMVKKSHPWLWLQSRLTRFVRWPKMMHRVSEEKRRHSSVVQ